jgi:site-specific DNA-cytosine methylase
MIGIDLFAGAGGMSLGALMAGVTVDFAVELDSFAAKTYSLNHPKSLLHKGDIRGVTKNKLLSWMKRRHDLVVFGGPPCQGFSRGERRVLYFHLSSSSSSENCSWDAAWRFPFCKHGRAKSSRAQKRRRYIWEVQCQAFQANCPYAT